MKNTEDLMDAAYKELDASPAGDGVSKAAMGMHPKNQQEDEAEHDEERNDRIYGEEDDEEECSPEDIERAYSMLFEALAIITRN